MKKVLIPLAPGFEEIEAIAVVDILRRAGVEVVTAGTAENPIEGRNKIRVLTDTSLDSVKEQDFDMIVLPGGAGGTENLKKDMRVKEIVERLSEERVVVDGNIVTSQGPGTAIEFAFKLVEVLVGKEKAREVNKGVLAKI